MIEFEMESNVKEVQSAKDRAIEKFLTEAGLHLAGGFADGVTHFCPNSKTVKSATFISTT